MCLGRLTYFECKGYTPIALAIMALCARPVVHYETPVCRLHNGEIKVIITICHGEQLYRAPNYGINSVHQTMQSYYVETSNMIHANWLPSLCINVVLSLAGGKHSRHHSNLLLWRENTGKLTARHCIWHRYRCRQGVTLV